MDAATLKAEIKAWERSFKASNGRGPTVQDIKLQPEIEDKYRLYKRLSKTSQSHHLAYASSDPPSTPPGTRSHSHQPFPYLLTQPRAIETTAPLSSFNPFSPQKNTRKDKHSHTKPRSNLFTSPFQSKAPSPNPLPLLKPSTASVTPSTQQVPSAVSRARKRLRGEPVSPTPNKGKRRRIEDTLQFARLVHDSSESEDDVERDVNSSFVSDSPVKVPAGDRSFKLLFHDTVAPKKDQRKEGTVTMIRTKISTTTHGLFGVGAVDEGPRWDISDTSSKTAKGKQKVGPFKTAVEQTTDSSVPMPNKVTLQIRQSMKRPLSKTESDTIVTPQETAPSAPYLLPPSPPPSTGPSFPSKSFANGKVKNTQAESKRRKKMKPAVGIEDRSEGGEDSSDSLHAPVKIVHRTLLRSNPTTSIHAGEGEDSDPDAILGYSHRVVPRGDGALLSPGDQQESKFEVDLPDKLRRVLALNTSESRIRDTQEERLVKGLVLGHREGHYDPTKGGEIWGVGEDDLRQDGEEEAIENAEGDDEWEGEPVPWEVGEL